MMKGLTCALRCVAVIIGFPVATGDGPAFLSSTTTIIPGTSNETFDCNPYDGVNYIIFGNGNGITATSCGSSWDLHEIEMWDENGVKITLFGAESLTGSDSGYPASQTIDGQSSTFWAGDHDIGMSCDCWDSSKKDGQSIRVSLGATNKVSKIRLQQGGAGNTWAISKIRIHCGAAYQANPLPLDISFGTTDIECNDAGCATVSMDPGYYHTCNAAATSFVAAAATSCAALAFLSAAAPYL